MSSKRATLPSSSRARARWTAPLAWLNNQSLRAPQIAELPDGRLLGHHRREVEFEAVGLALELRGREDLRLAAGRRRGSCRRPSTGNSVSTKRLEIQRNSPAGGAILYHGAGCAARGRAVVRGVEDLDRFAAVEADLDTIADVAEAAAHAGGHALLGHGGDIFVAQLQVVARQPRRNCPARGRMASQPPGSWR